MTNRDRINNMSNEELATFINDPSVECHSCMYYSMPEHPCDDCKKGILEYLESEVVTNDE